MARDGQKKVQIKTTFSQDLLEEFDRFVKKKKFTSRSETLVWCARCMMEQTREQELRERECVLREKALEQEKS